MTEERIEEIARFLSRLFDGIADDLLRTGEDGMLVDPMDYKNMPSVDREVIWDSVVDRMFGCSWLDPKPPITLQEWIKVSAETKQTIKLKAFPYESYCY